MISFAKGVLPGALLTWLVSLFVGTGGSHGGFLNVHLMTVQGEHFFWSWPLFFTGTALSAFFFATLD
ncbi:hypothetical protein ACXYN8_03170 [Altererythrobacter sp. CAU 1778]